MKIQRKILFAVGVATLSFASQGTFAACSDITRAELVAAVGHVRANEKNITKGLRNHMWVTMVDRTGRVCHVVNSAGEGQRSGKTWGLSRVISAQKANTANGLSLDNPFQAWASAEVYVAAQPGGFLYGVQHSNPIDADDAYAGSPANYGTANDPMINHRIGGVNVFGGGLPLYKDGGKIGAIGASGDTSCTDHAFAWRVREALHVAGLADVGKDDVMDLDNPATPEVDGHPICPLMPIIDAVQTGITP